VARKLLEIEQISYRYRPHADPVLQDLSMSIEKGTVNTILGPNGAGKSTLLDICLGWKEPEAGRILLDQKEIRSFTRRQMGRWMSLVPQDEQVRFDYTVLEYLLLGRAPYLSQLEMPGAEDVDIARASLQKVGLLQLQERPASKLSGGEHQLLMIARALVQEPQILILDEPTSRLDPGNRQRVVSLLKSLLNHGVTILFTTHDPTLAADISTHALLLKQGRVIHAGPEKEVLTGEHLSELYGISMEVLRRNNKTIVFSAE
jgi:iron complex transport system ATP-binding protein